MEIKQTDTGTKGAFFIEIDGKRVAQMTYTHAKPNKLIIDHTEVSETLKGQGVGYKLIEASVNFMRLNNLKVMPLCQFANAAFKKRKNDYLDVLV